MERLLPIALREFLPTNVWRVLSELSLLYRDLYTPKLSMAHAQNLEKDIAYLVYKLEKIFPPRFFDIVSILLCIYLMKVKLVAQFNIDRCTLLRGNLKFYTYVLFLFKINNHEVWINYSLHH